MTEQEVLQILKNHIFTVYGTKSYYAECKGISESYVSLALSGKRSIPKTMLKDIGYEKERVVTFKFNRLPDQGRDSFQ